MNIAHIKTNLKKHSLILLSTLAFMFTFSLVGHVFASSHFENIDAGEYPTGSSEFGVIELSDVLDSPKCSKLRGLTASACELSYLGYEICSNDAVVCNRADEDITQTEKTRFNSGEKTDYCLLPDNYCYNEALWGEDGLAAYQDQQYQESWDALAEGDLAGFLCNQIEGGTEGFFGCEDEEGNTQVYVMPVEETTFTQFGGEFAPPAPEGYSEGLVQNKSVREYVLNVTNFVLGFLGLVAVLAIIYGGFIYLTAGGDEGKTENGKKSIIYAVIGIVIILGAFALVRTVICYVGVGGDDRPSFCRSGGSGAVIGGQLDLTEEVGDSATTTFENAQDRLRDISEGAIRVSTTYLNVSSAASYLPGIEYALQGGLDESAQILSQLRRSLTDFPRTLKRVEVMMQYLGRQRPIATTSRGEVAPLSSGDRLLAKAERSWFSKMLQTVVLSTFDDLPSGNGDGEDASPLESTSGFPSGNAELSGEGEESYEDAYDFVDQYTLLLQSSAELDYDENIQKYIRYSESLEDLFAEIEEPRKEMEDITSALELLRTQRASRDRLTDLIIEINQGFEAVKNLEFVTVKLNASTKRCSAPCVVLFDSVGTIDPSDKTILDAQHSWDLDGDGVPDEMSTSCKEEKLSAVSCVYETPGTYRVALRVDSAEPAKYASGLSIGRIEVSRPLSKVKVKVTTTDGVEVMSMDNTVSPPIRNSRTKFTVEQARAGLLFDATGSLGSSGTPITEYTWNFGTDQFAGNSPSKTYSFTQQGTYRAILDVLESGVAERAVVIVEVGSPAAHFEIMHPSGNTEFETGQTVSFDGSFSKSDNGNITSYTWRVYKGEELVKEETVSTPEYSFSPSAPGSYRVLLEVIDSVGESDVTENTFIVQSRQPQSCFTYEFSDSFQPSTAQFKNCSIDPDTGDVLSYEWTVENGEFAESTDASSAEPVVKFTRKGTQSVSLKVSDQYIEEELRKEHTTSTEIEVASILDIALDIPDGLAYQLSSETSAAEVNFEIQSENATFFEIDYGDENEKVGNAGTGSMTFTHTYTTAGVYLVTATVFDADDESNTMTRKIFIGESDAPLPVLEVKVDGQMVELNDTGMLEVPRSTPVTFDGSASLNKDGSGRKLLYTINYGDGTVGANKVSTRTYEDVYEDVGEYEVSFTVTDEDTGTYNTIPLTLNVIDVPPRVNSLISQVISTSLTTPIDVSLSVDSEDRDGRIIQYTWYLFDGENTADVLQTQVSNSDRTVFTFHGLGTTGEEHRIGFCVAVKDDGNNETDSCADGPYTYVVTVTGENEPPRAKFSIADNTVRVGDPVVFYDESTDDGEIAEVFYDVLGNGFQDDLAVEAHSFSHTYERIGQYNMRIKVVDANGASSVSPAKPVIVETSVQMPVARIMHEVENLSVDFSDNSIIDPATELESREWDFDTDTDSDGDGNKENDVDSTEAEPTHSYPDEDEYEVKLTVQDKQGNIDDVTSSVETEEEPLEARMLTNPAASPSDNKVHLQGTQSEVRVDFSTSSGSIVKYSLDGNVLYDSDGNGVKDDDADQVFTSPREALFVYRAEWLQPFVIKLTVEDNSGNSDFVTKQVVFDSPPAPAPAE